MGFSLIALIDGAEDCGEESTLSYYGLIIWILLILYLFMGLYVLCEHYFVPILISISRRLNMSEDVAGATLMAAGSSAPELFTALIGVLFYAEENPGPSTNCASCAFNMCVIVGASIYFSGYTSLQIRGYPFVRDCSFYALAVIQLYLFWEVITPGSIGWVESLTLVTSWVSYIVVLIYNNQVIKLLVNLMNWMGLTAAESMLYEQLKSDDEEKQKLKQINMAMSDDGYDCSDYDDESSGNILEYEKIDNINQLNNGIIPIHAMNIEEPDIDDMNMQINDKIKILTRPPIRMGGIPSDGGHMTNTANNTTDRGTDSEYELEHRRRGAQSKCMRYFNNSIKPFNFMFKWTIPKTSNNSSTPLLMISFSLCILWLAVLTFICVDSAEKMGNCLGINNDVMGLTILAIGSSLPDCFSSVLAAKQGKGGMAVSNALGSNVFDINICIGLSFLLKSIINGSAVIVERTTGFELFIAALFLLLSIFMVSMFCYGLVLNNRIGGILFFSYAVFLGVFCYLLQYY